MEELARITFGLLKAYDKCDAHTVIHRAPLESNPGLIFEVIAKDADDEIWFNLYKGVPESSHDHEREMVAEVNLHCDTLTDTWDLIHREVGMQYRGQGVFTAVLKAAEAFIKRYAQSRQEKQIFRANVAQPSVLSALLAEGFTPDAASRETLERILRGDNSLYCAYGYDEGRPGEGIVLLKDTDPFIFEAQGGRMLTQPLAGDAVRVNLFKEISLERLLGIEALIERFRAQMRQV